MLIEIWMVAETPNARTHLQLDHNKSQQRAELAAALLSTACQVQRSLDSESDDGGSLTTLSLGACKDHETQRVEHGKAAYESRNANTQNDVGLKLLQFSEVGAPKKSDHEEGQQTAHAPYRRYYNLYDIAYKRGLRL